MALVRNRKLFTARWQEGLRGVPESAMVAKVGVYTRTVAYVNNVPTVVKTYLYEGEARVQPLGVVTKASNVGDTTYVQRVLVSIPMADYNLRTEEVYTDVTECLLNPELVGLVFQVRETLDSSNPIERTFIVETDSSG